jgi:hypothetical protein
MKSLNCPECDISEVIRIGLYEYRCNIYGEVINFIEGIENTDNWFPEEEDNFKDD